MAEDSKRDPLWHEYLVPFRQAAAALLLIGIPGAAYEFGVEKERIDFLKQQEIEVVQNQKELLRIEAQEEKRLSFLEAKQDAEQHSHHVPATSCACVNFGPPVYVAVCDVGETCDEPAIKTCEIQHPRTKCMPLK